MVKFATIALTGSLAITSCLSSQALAAPTGTSLGSTPKTASSVVLDSAVKATSNVASVSASGSKVDTASGAITSVASSTEAVLTTSTLAQATTQAAVHEAEAVASATCDVDPTSKILAFDPDVVAGVSTQVETGHTSCCLAFSQAMGDSIMAGVTVDHTEYAMNGDCAWSPCAALGVWTDESWDLSAVYDEINAGRPAVVFVTGPGFSHHWVLAIGYTGVEDPGEMSLDNLVIIDPWDGETMVASERFSDSGTIKLVAMDADDADDADDAFVEGDEE